LAINFFDTKHNPPVVVFSNKIPYMIALAGWVGALGLLFAFVASSLDKLDNLGTPYHLINLICSLLLILNATANEAYPFILINSFWSLMSVYSIGRNLLNKNAG
jgi:hypothetical protein